MKIHFISLLLVATAALGDSSRLNADNSRGSQFFRLDQNGSPSIRKEGVLYDLRRRSLVNNLLESDETSIQNVIDNSNPAQTTSSHGNTHTSTTTITRIRKEPSSEAEQWVRQSGLFNRRTTGPPTALVVVSNVQDADEHGWLLDRRGVSRGESATAISNVNDKRKEKEGMEALDPSESRIHSRRALYKFESTHMSHPQPEDQGDNIGSNSIDKRAITTTLTTTTTTAIVEFGDDSIAKKKKVEDIARRNLVTIQIITQNRNTNTNGHSIDNSSNNNNVYPVKVIHQGDNDKKKKKKEKKDSPHHRPSSPASKKNKKPVVGSNQPKSQSNKKHDHSKKSVYATKSSNRTKKVNNKSRPRRPNNAKHAN